MGKWTSAGRIDIIANFDPVITTLQLTNEVVLLADTRTTEGTTKIVGGAMPATVLYLKCEFMEQNPNTVQALVNAFFKGLNWLHKATPTEIADKVLPAEYWLPHRATCMLRRVRSTHCSQTITASDIYRWPLSRYWLRVSWARVRRSISDDWRRIH